MKSYHKEQSEINKIIKLNCFNKMFIKNIFISKTQNDDVVSIHYFHHYGIVKLLPKFSFQGSRHRKVTNF